MQDIKFYKEIKYRPCSLNTTVKMTSLQGKKPFYKKSFYLDLKGYRQETQLIKDLKRLGGRQESFLSKEVSFVITSGVQSKHDFINSTSNISSCMIPAPSPGNGNVLRNYDSPPYSSSPIPDEFNFAPAPLSRGLSLIQKAKQKKQGTTDVLEVCKQWNIKVIPLQKVLLWLSKNKILTHRKEAVNKRSKAVENQKLEVPFIKVEDVKRAYRTRYKLFDSLYGSIDKDFQRSIRQICKKTQVSKILDFSSTPSSPILKERNHRVKELSQASLFQAPSIGRSTTPTMATVSGQFNINPYASTSVHFSADKRKDTKIKEKENVKKKEKGGQTIKTSKKKYCELCNSYYIVLDEHLEVQSHKKYLKDSSRFAAVSEIVSALPSLEQFLQACLATSNNPGQPSTNTAEPELPSDKSEAPILMPKDDASPLEESLSSSDMPNLETAEGGCQSTEEYSLVDEYISGSCTSPEQLTDFPFLENTKGLPLHSLKEKTVAVQDLFINPENPNDLIEAVPLKEPSSYNELEEEFTLKGDTLPEKITQFSFLEDTKNLALFPLKKETVSVQDLITAPENNPEAVPLKEESSCHYNDLTEELDLDEINNFYQADTSPIIGNMGCNPKAGCVEMYQINDDVEDDHHYPVDYSMNHDSSVVPLDFKSIENNEIHYGVCKRDDELFMSYEISIPNAHADTICIFDDKMHSFSETVDLMKHKCISSIVQRKPASIKSCCSGYQSEDTLSSSSEQSNIWNTIENDLDIQIKSMEEKENMALDLSVNKV